MSKNCLIGMHFHGTDVLVLWLSFLFCDYELVVEMCILGEKAHCPLVVEVYVHHEKGLWHMAPVEVINDGCIL